MRRSCLIALLIGVALFAVYAIWPYDDVPVLARLLIGSMMAALVGLGLLLMNGLRYAIHDREARARMTRGHPRDGDRIGVVGTIRPTLEPLRAPFSDRACVLYKYDVKTPRGAGENVLDYAGFAVTRCAIHSRHGTFVVGSFPVLAGFEAKRIEAAGAEESVRATVFEEMSTFKHLAKSSLALYGETPPFRKDWQIGEAHPSLRDAEVFETVVPAGAEVTAYGRYDAARHAVVADLRKREYLRLRAGDPGSGFSAAVLAQFFSGLALIAAAHLMLWVVLNQRVL